MVGSARANPRLSGDTAQADRADALAVDERNACAEELLSQGSVVVAGSRLADGHGMSVFGGQPCSQSIRCLDCNHCLDSWKGGSSCLALGSWLPAPQVSLPVTASRNCW